MAFLSNISKYLPLLFWVGLCPFTLNRQLNQITPCCKVLYAIVAGTLLTLSSIYINIYSVDFLYRPSATNILIISESISMTILTISCAIVIGSSIMKSHKAAELLMCIETLDDQIARKSIGLVERTETNCITTIFLPSLIFFGWQLFAGYNWLYRTNAITIGFVFLHATQRIILTLSVLHVRYLCMELLSQLNRINQFGHEIRAKYPSNERTMYQKFGAVIELWDMFQDAKFILNENIGWTLVGNYVSDFIFMAMSLFVLLMYAGVMPQHTIMGHWLQAVDIFIVYTMPYGIKAVRTVQAMVKIGASRQVGFNFF